jgi:hypothetical protein
VLAFTVEQKCERWLAGRRLSTRRRRGAVPGPGKQRVAHDLTLRRSHAEVTRRSTQFPHLELAALPERARVWRFSALGWLSGPGEAAQTCLTCKSSRGGTTWSSPRVAPHSSPSRHRRPLPWRGSRQPRRRRNGTTIALTESAPPTPTTRSKACTSVVLLISWAAVRAPGRQIGQSRSPRRTRRPRPSRTSSRSSTGLARTRDPKPPRGAAPTTDEPLPAGREHGCTRPVVRCRRRLINAIKQRSDLATGEGVCSRSLVQRRSAYRRALA